MWDSRRETATWIAADEPPAFEVVNPCGRSRAILTCDHAGPRIPRRVGDLGLAAADRLRHVAWDAVRDLVKSRMGRYVLPVMVSIHSFTPVYLDRTRFWQIGVHYRLGRRLAALALDALRVDATLTVGENAPYPVALDEDYTIPVHAELLGLRYVLFEIRQDLLNAESRIDAWADRRGDLLAKALTDPSLDHLSPPATHLRAPRYQKEP
jgi:predicted N-formylglutamate amidohydrolase